MISETRIPEPPHGMEAISPLQRRMAKPMGIVVGVDGRIR
jgi:hypothetical protein